MPALVWPQGCVQTEALLRGLQATTLAPPQPPAAAVGPLAASSLPCSSRRRHCSSCSTRPQQLPPSSLAAAGPRRLCQAAQDAQSSRSNLRSSRRHSSGTRCQGTLTRTPKCSSALLHG
jgi:hypothetical protein